MWLKNLSCGWACMLTRFLHFLINPFTQCCTKIQVVQHRECKMSILNHLFLLKRNVNFTLKDYSFLGCSKLRCLYKPGTGHWIIFKDIICVTNKLTRVTNSSQMVTWSEWLFDKLIILSHWPCIICALYLFVHHAVVVTLWNCKMNKDATF